MGDDEAFTNWLENSNHEAEFISAIRLLQEKYKKAIYGLQQAGLKEGSRKTQPWDVLAELGEPISPC